MEYQFFHIFLIYAKLFPKRIIFHRDILYMNLCNRKSFKNLKLKESI